MPVPGYVTYSASKSFVSQLGQGLSYELDGLGVDVLTYQPGYINTPHFQPNALKGLLSEEPMKCAKVALAEMEMSPYGAGAGINIKHEMTEYLMIRVLMQFGMFNRLMYNFGVQAQKTKQERDI